jgi:hypothetical protein
MTVNETNTLCEALEHFIACPENRADPETVRIAEKLLSRYIDAVCTQLTAVGIHNASC